MGCQSSKYLPIWTSLANCVYAFPYERKSGCKTKTIKSFLSFAMYRNVSSARRSRVPPCGCFSQALFASLTATVAANAGFFTFNGAECSGPMPIDGIVYMQGLKTLQPLRVRHIEGYCENIPRGEVRVGFNVGNCAGYGNADAHSGWNSVSRIVVEEVPAPQK